MSLFKRFSLWSHVYSGWLTVCITAILVVVFVLLSFKVPYSDRTLIGNLEPYPDTLYYSVPAWNLTHGGGFDMDYNGHSIKLETPPLYSLYLVPFFALFDDVRSYYFANMILGIATIILLIKALRQIFSGAYSVILVLFLGFLYVTNFYIYTFPSLLMAENLTMFLMVWGMYILVTEQSVKSVTVMAGVIGALVMTKISNLPIAVSLSVFTLGRLIVDKNTRLIKRYLMTQVLFAFISLIYFIKTDFFVGHKNLEEGTTFLFDNFKSGFSFYSKAIMGKDTVSLWFSQKLSLFVISAMAGGGLLMGGIYQKYRFVTLFAVFSTFATLVFMSFFYYHDARYVLVIWPLMLVGVGVLMHAISDYRYSRLIVGSLMILIVSVLFLSKDMGYKHGERGLVTFARQVGVNIKGRQVPWNYKAVEHFNTFFEDRNNTVLATFLPPYYVNYFTNHKYEFAPLSLSQEFFWYQNGLNKSMQIKSVDKYLTAKMKSGKKVYVSNAYVGNLSGWGAEFDAIKSKFGAKIVSRGCLDTCNIYQLSPIRN